MILLRFLRHLLVLLILLAVLDAFSWEAQAGLGSYFSGMATRSRVIQVCVVTMAVALLIMMKKFSPLVCDPRAFAPKMNYAPSERSPFSDRD